MTLPMKRSFSSEGGSSSKRDWKMRLSLRSRSGHSVDALRGRRCASLRSAANAARPNDESGRSTPSALPRTSPSPADTPAPKKSNWEVIEHFSSSRSRTRSPTAVENESGDKTASPALPLCPAGRPNVEIEPLLNEAEADPEAGGVGAGDGEADVEDVETGCLAICEQSCPPPLRELCHTNRFRNLHVEMLYQRYFLRMNQNNMTHTLGLLLGIAASIIAVHGRCLYIAQQFINGQALANAIRLLSSSKILPNRDIVQDLHGMVTKNVSALLNNLNDTNIALLIYEQDRLAHGLNVAVIGFCCLVYLCLLLCLTRPAMNEIYLLTISYIVLATFVVMEVSLSTSAILRAVQVSVGPAALFTYLTYATLPVRLHEACFGGFVIALANIIAHCMMPNVTQFQVYASLVCLVACNIAGVLTHQPRELAQRRAFLETRDCVEARLVTQRENQQQERLLLSVLPRHVAMEMKADIANQPRQEQFHKIYIQRYENVRSLENPGPRRQHNVPMTRRNFKPRVETPETRPEYNSPVRRDVNLEAAGTSRQDYLPMTHRNINLSVKTPKTSPSTQYTPMPMTRRDLTLSLQTSGTSRQHYTPMTRGVKKTVDSPEAEYYVPMSPHNFNLR